MKQTEDKRIVVAAVNSCNCGSTGTIALEIVRRAVDRGGDGEVFCPRTLRKYYRPGYHYYGTAVEHKLSRILSKYILTGRTMLFATLRLIRCLNKMKPTVIHLHNLHNDTVNLPLLFGYIKRHDIPVVWTLHDCWSFTGHCPHFSFEKCSKWQTGCHSCPLYREYPVNYFDNSRKMWRLKKRWFSGVKDLTVVTPSRWLAELTRRSYLQDYPVRVINNGINLSVFTPTDSDFRSRYGIENKHIVLGVSFNWGYKKGLDVFAQLAGRLGDDYQVVLVGTNEAIDSQLPHNIISIHRTHDRRELAEIYTAADIFVNPTREEVLGLVNIEALACGTPVLTFDTGGSPECIDDTCGSVVACDDIDAVEREVIRICETSPYSASACVERASAFDADSRFEEYLDLYEEIL